MIPDLPEGALVFPLQAGTKVPLEGSRGHLEAVDPDLFDFSLVPEQVNYGIRLDGRFLLVDFDQDVRHLPPWNELPPTRVHKTGRGWHYFYSYTGKGKNVPVSSAVQLKVRGYAVGPGSVVGGKGYAVMDSRPPADVPAWLATMVGVRESEAESTESGSLVEVGGIAAGGHDQFLHTVGSWLRGRWELSPEAIERFLAAGPLAVLDGTDPERPYTQTDLHRLAKSAGSYEPGTTAVVHTATLRSGDSVPAVPPVTAWVLPGFVPCGGLTVLYGDGKIGKSSFASYLAAGETRRGGKVVFVPSGEETFDLFVQRARLNLGDDRLLYEFGGVRLDLSAGVVGLETAVRELGGVTLVYIDALYSHFGAGPVGENEATRARGRLAPLARMAESLGIAVLGTIHKNKGGGSLGSAEMRNVSRSFIHASGGKGRDFTIWADGANGWSPDYGVSFPGRAVPVADENGEPMYFTDMFGDKIPQSIWVLGDPYKAAAQPTTVDVDTLDETTATVKEYYVSNPGASIRDGERDLGISKSTIQRILSQ